MSSVGSNGEAQPANPTAAPTLPSKNTSGGWGVQNPQETSKGQVLTRECTIFQNSLYFK